MHVSWFYPAVIEAKEIAGCTVSPPTKLLFICMLISMLRFRCKVYEHFLHFTPVSRKTKTKVFHSAHEVQIRAAQTAFAEGPVLFCFVFNVQPVEDPCFNKYNKDELFR